MSAPNAELAYRVLDTARAVDRLDMDEWSNSGDKPIGLAELTAVETCGTTACLAGWTAAMHGLKVDTAGRVYDASGTDVGHVEYVAADLLGISSGQAHDLFYVENEDLDEAFVEVFGPRPEPAPVDYDKPLVPVLGVPASGCDCSHDGGHGLAPWPDRDRGHAEDCPAFGQAPAPALPYGTGCRCTVLGEGTPEHSPSSLCLPDGGAK